MRIGLSAIASLLLWSTLAHSDPPRELKAGDHFRIAMMGGQHEFVLDRVRADTLFVTHGKQDAVYWIMVGQVQEIEVRVRRSSGIGALRGLAIGGGIDAALGMLVGVANWNDENENCGDSPLGDVCSDTISTAQLIGYVTVFGIPGMAIGAFVGAAAPGGTWQPVDLSETLTLRSSSEQVLYLGYAGSF